MPGVVAPSSVGRMMVILSLVPAANAGTVMSVAGSTPDSVTVAVKVPVSGLDAELSSSLVRFTPMGSDELPLSLNSRVVTKGLKDNSTLP